VRRPRRRRGPLVADHILRSPETKTRASLGPHGPRETSTSHYLSSPSSPASLPLARPPVAGRRPWRRRRLRAAVLLPSRFLACLSGNQTVMGRERQADKGRPKTRDSNRPANHPGPTRARPPWGRSGTKGRGSRGGRRRAGRRAPTAPTRASAQIGNSVRTRSAGTNSPRAKNVTLVSAAERSKGSG